MTVRVKVQGAIEAGIGGGSDRSITPGLERPRRVIRYEHRHSPCIYACGVREGREHVKTVIVVVNLGSPELGI
jgi:hypothetical protein